MKSACELRIRRSNGIDAPLDLLVGKAGRILWAVTHELVSDGRKNGGWKPTTNHPENQQAKKTKEYLGIFGRSHPGAASPMLNSSRMPVHWSAAYTEDYYGEEGEECRPDDFRNPHGT